MSSLPFMPVYVRDYLVETLTLSLEARGVYSDLLCHLWNNEGKPLKNSEITLSKLLRIRPQTWRRIAPEVLGLFEVSDNMLIHRGLEDKYREAARIHESRVAGGNMTAAKRYGNMDSSATSSAKDESGCSAGSNHNHSYNYNHKTLSQEGEKKVPRDTPSKDSDALKLVEHLRERIIKNNPLAKPNSDGWKATATLMIEEGRAPDDIAFVIDWSQRHKFWKTRTMSMANIKKHFDKLVLQSGLSEKYKLLEVEARRQRRELERRIQYDVDEAMFEANKEESVAARLKFVSDGRKRHAQIKTENIRFCEDAG